MRHYVVPAPLLGGFLIASLTPSCAPSHPATPELPHVHLPATAATRPDTGIPKPRIDFYGDPLPPGAIARIGTARNNVIINVIDFSPDGKTLASGSWDGKIHLWEVATGNILQEFKGHQAAISSISFSPDGKTLGSSSKDNTIRLWEVATGKILKLRHSSGNYSVIYSPDGKPLALGFEDSTIRLLEAATGNILNSFNGHEGRVTSVSISPDGKILASGSREDKTVRLWETATGKELAKFDTYQYSFSPVAFSPNGKTLALRERYNTIRLWEVATGKEFRKFEGYDNQMLSIDFSPDGKTLASGSGNGTISLWNADTGKELHEFVGQGIVVGVDYSPSGKLLASGHMSTAILVWDVDTSFPPDNAISKSTNILWEDLISNDASRACASIAALANGESDIVPFLRGKMNPIPFNENLPQQILKSIDDLNHDNIDVRDKAEKELMSRGHTIEPVLSHVLTSTQTAEVKLRIDRILVALNPPFPIPPGEPLRRWRAIQVLERIGTNDSREVLEMLEMESPYLRERREAKAALDRINRMRQNE
jgi:uncharacterized protein with WD repeat